MALEIDRTRFITIICRSCQIRFSVCRACYRGHRYCSGGCRDFGYKECRKKANKKYASSAEAKNDHSDRNRVYRQRIRDKQIISKKSVMDKSSTIFSAQLNEGFQSCALCGKALIFIEDVDEDLDSQFFDSH